MDTLDSRGDARQGATIDAELATRLQNQKRPYALTSGKRCIAHRLDHARLRAYRLRQMLAQHILHEDGGLI